MKYMTLKRGDALMIVFCVVRDFWNGFVYWNFNWWSMEIGVALSHTDLE